MELFKTNRGKPRILYDGFRFRKDRDSKTVHLWRCVKKLALQILAAGRGKAVKI